MQFRKQEVEKLKDPKVLMGDVTSVNLTMIEGGSQSNVVPAELRATFDIRIAVDVDLDAFDKQIEEWCSEAGGGIAIKMHHKDPKVKPTILDSSNPFWVAFENAIKEL